MDRLFAADRARRDGQSRLQRHSAFKLEIPPRRLLGKSPQCSKNRIALFESLAHGRRGVEHEGPRFAKREETQHVVQVAVGQEDRTDGRVTLAARKKGGEMLDLAKDIGRSVD